MSDSSGSDGGGSNLDGVERKLANFKLLYSAHKGRRQQDVSEVKALLRQAAAPPPDWRAEGAGRPASATPTRHDAAPRHGEAGDWPLPDAHTLQRMFSEFDIKSSTLNHITTHITKLQSQLHVQRAEQDELRADHQRQVGRQPATAPRLYATLLRSSPPWTGTRCCAPLPMPDTPTPHIPQVQELQGKLAVAADQLGKLQAERWEVLEAMSTMGAEHIQHDKERRELEGARLQLEALQRELEAREALARSHLQARARPLPYTHMRVLHACMDPQGACALCMRLRHAGWLSAWPVSLSPLAAQARLHCVAHVANCMHACIWECARRKARERTCPFGLPMRRPRPPPLLVAARCRPWRSICLWRTWRPSPRSTQSWTRALAASRRRSNGAC